MHRLLPTTYPAGTTFKLQIDSEDTASTYTIDFADFEQAGAALTQPAGSVSVTSEGADATGASDSTSAFNGRVHVQPLDRQHSHDHLPLHDGPVRAAEHHRQRRVARRAGLGVPGLDQLSKEQLT